MPSIFYNILFAPLELVIEIVFEFLFRLLGKREFNQGLTLIGVSLVVSLSTLPLYRKADKIQREARQKQKDMDFWINHIRKTFKGDERFMMLQEYYRLNDYSPISSLKSAFPLLLQIPFFTAAYHFLSHLEALQGASFALISDLGKPDGLISIGSFTINLLPVLMTTINCISSALYLKGFHLKDKIQTYGMALIFLFILYNSPSGLVIYWTCNNLFSLIKNIFYKLKNPRKAVNYVSSICGTLFIIATIISGVLNSTKKYVAVIILFICSFIPAILSIFEKNKSKDAKKDIYIKSKNSKNIPLLFLLISSSLIILYGLLIPSSVLSSSPAEFIDLKNYRNPLYFLINSSCYAIGFFFIWAGIIRYTLPYEHKNKFDFIISTMFVISIINFMFFGKHLGVLSPLLTFTEGLNIKKNIQIVNLFVILTAPLIFFLVFKYKNILSYISLVLLITTSLLSIKNIYKTSSILNKMSYIKDINKSSKLDRNFTLSTTGKNVIVFMLDRAISGYIPYIFEERPELKEEFSGFTYYPNTISHGFSTNFGTPGLFGGYEYTPKEMNKRNTELLVDKHNEALKVLPVLFNNNNYKVTVCDPPYAGYKLTPDLSIFDNYSDITTFLASGIITNDNLVISANKNAFLINQRNFFCYSIFKSLPLVVSNLFYDDGNYFSSKKKSSIPQGFLEEFSVLTKLKDLTIVSDNAINTYLAMTNSTTHEPCILQLPDFEIKEHIDNTNYSTIAEKYIQMEDVNQIAHYHTNVAALMEIGKWLQYLKEYKVYDNTRIILVADHGRGLAQFDYMLMHDPEIDIQWCNPLLMVKDFDSKTFSICNDFMTIADVPTLATKDLIQNPINPFTGKLISNSDKFLSSQFITSSMNSNTEENNGLIFNTSDGNWYSVNDNIFDEKNWTIIKQ